MAEWKQFRSGLLPFTLQVSRNTNVTGKVAMYPPTKSINGTHRLSRPWPCRWEWRSLWTVTRQTFQKEHRTWARSPGKPLKHKAEWREDWGIKCVEVENGTPQKVAELLPFLRSLPGLSSLMADFKRPLQSSELQGLTTLRPGQWAYLQKHKRTTITDARGDDEERCAHETSVAHWEYRF